MSPCPFPSTITTTPRALWAMSLKVLGPYWNNWSSLLKLALVISHVNPSTRATLTSPCSAKLKQKILVIFFFIIVVVVVVVVEEEGEGEEEEKKKGLKG